MKKLLFKVHYSFLFAMIMLSGCSSLQNKLHRSLSKEDPKYVNYIGHYKVGNQYKIKNQTYIPKVDNNYDEIGTACWYGDKDGFHGKKTANGEIYNRLALSAAHKTLPLPSLVKVTNLSNGKSLIVSINDRGPYHKNRLIDLSERAAEILAFKKQGTAKVRVQYLPKETEQFLKNISLAPKHNAKPKGKTKSTCSINCQIKLINMQHKLAFVP